MSAFPSIHFFLLSGLILVLEVTLQAEETPLDATEIVRRAHEAAKKKETPTAVYTFLREVALQGYDSKGSTTEKKTKTYRAYTDEREQELLSINGHKATPEEIAEEEQRNRQQKRRFLNADPMNPAATGGRDENLMDRNITLFHKKFDPKLLGEESIQNRPAYIVDLAPNPKYRISHKIVDRIFNQLSLKVWIDQQDYEVAKLEANLLDKVSFLGGLAGVVKDLKITVNQSRLGENQWVDETVKAFFDARVLWKAYHFGMESRSEAFERLE